MIIIVILRQVQIVSISAGSVSVGTKVTFDSLDAGGDMVLLEQKANSFVQKLQTAPDEVFKAAPSNDIDFESFGDISAVNTVKVGLSPGPVIIPPSCPPPDPPPDPVLTPSCLWDGGAEYPSPYATTSRKKRLYWLCL
jgi:hypothetical protein